MALKNLSQNKMKITSWAIRHWVKTESLLYDSIIIIQRLLLTLYCDKVKSISAVIWQWLLFMKHKKILKYKRLEKTRKRSDKKKMRKKQASWDGNYSAMYWQGGCIFLEYTEKNGAFT